MSNLTSEQISGAIAPYQSCKMVDAEGDPSTLSWETIEYGKVNQANGWKLVLRSIDSLTDEERNELHEVAGVFTVDHLINAIKNKTPYVMGITGAVEAIDYLRSVFIDFPSYHLEGKSLVEAGLATLEGGEG
jgi:hypothetical protein